MIPIFRRNAQPPIVVASLIGGSLALLLGGMYLLLL